MTKKKVQNLLKHLVCILLCLTVILPFYMVVINSFKSKGEASRMSLALPKEWLFSNYTEVIDKGNLLQGFSNSLLYALVATTLGVVLCAMAAFVMCRKRTRLNVFLYYFVLCGLFFPVNYVTLVRVLSTLHPVSYTHLDVYKRQGAIIPVADGLVYAEQEPEKPVQIIVYPGADGEFVLYEDEGNNYNFENGAYATTRFQWKDAAGQLVNGRREGSFPGMREAVYETVIIK